MRRITDTTSAEEAPTAPIHIKYRPVKLSQVLGQKAIVKSLEAAMSAKARPHCYLFTGPAGTGKTTLARIVASSSGVSASGLVEANAASHTGADDMRALLVPLRYNGFGDSPNKAIILDECHRLSKNAWDVLLKDTEEPPPHVYFIFCTTEPDKVPKTMVTRCSAYNLAPVRFDDILDLLERVCDDEGYKTSNKVLAMVAQACEGSPRNALTMLATVHECDAEEAEVLLQQPLDNKEIIDLCRMLVKGDLQWGKLVATLKEMSEMSAESMRIVIVNYLASCTMGARHERDTTRLLYMLECFAKPFNTSDKLAPLLIAFGRLIYPD